MNINIEEDKKVDIDMREQLLEATEAFLETIDEEIATPTYIYLFVFKEQAQQLDEEKSEISHLVVTKLIYIMIRAGPGGEKSISILCKRVSKRDMGASKNLNRLLSWVKKTIHDKKVIGAESFTYVYTWIDAAYMFNKKIRSHTGWAISIVHGVLHEKGSVQNLNTKISKEA